MAWLNATPKPDPRTRRGKVADAPPLVSRLARMKKSKVEPAMPPMSAPHIINRLLKIGLVASSGMGASPISWAEINEWQRATGISLGGWEADLIHTLSVEYVAWTKRAEDEHCPPPWRAPITQADIEAEYRALDAILG